MKRAMKSGILTGVMLLLLSVTAWAAQWTTYDLKEVGVKIDIPSEYITFTRDLEEDDPNLANYGITKEDMESYMTEYNVYLRSIHPQMNYHLSVAMEEQPVIEDFVFDIRQFTDAELEEMVSELGESFSEQGVNVLCAEIYHHSQIQFAKIYTLECIQGENEYILYYSTMCANKRIDIAMYQYTDELDAEAAVLMEEIIDSIEFDLEPLPQQPEEPLREPTPSYVYTDDKTGLKFTVPEDWVEIPVPEEREDLDVNLVSNRSGAKILFTSGDLWGSEELQEGLAFWEKHLYSRADLNHSFMTKERAAEVFECSEQEVSLVTYAEKEYYRTEKMITTPVNGVMLSSPMVMLIRLENGYVYSLYFQSMREEWADADFADFESLMESMQYPTSEESMGYEAKLAIVRVGLELVLSFVLTVSVYSLPIIIYRYAIRRAPVEKKKAKWITIIYGICAGIVMTVILFSTGGKGINGTAIVLWSGINYRMLIGGKKRRAVSTDAPVGTETDADTAAASRNGESTIRCCHHCGSQLVGDVLYCHKCGTRILEEEEK